MWGHPNCDFLPLLSVEKKAKNSDNILAVVIKNPSRQAPRHLDHISLVHTYMRCPHMTAKYHYRDSIDVSLMHSYHEMVLSFKQ